MAAVQEYKEDHADLSKIEEGKQLIKAASRDPGAIVEFTEDMKEDTQSEDTLR